MSGDELATRLSFLLWDSIPDDELRGKAARLHEPAVMEEQLRRMLKDGRMRGMAEEFGARWLGVRDFVANHGRSLKHFPEFTPAVRDALAEEPVRFFEDLLVNDRPVADVIAADAAVVNDVLAKHYGIPGVTGPEWRRVEKVSAYGRGGLLGFGAVLAKQSAAARTSPIKRGAWLVQVLGERLPKVPPGVPPLPETPPAGLSVREITERHRQDPKCAGCHARIDPYGMAHRAVRRHRPVPAGRRAEAGRHPGDAARRHRARRHRRPAGIPRRPPPRGSAADFRPQADGLRAGPRRGAVGPQACRRTDQDHGRWRPLVGRPPRYCPQRAVSLHSAGGRRGAGRRIPLTPREDTPMPTEPAPTFSRRTLLRGLGVSMALPWLESLPFAAAAATSAADQPPTRTLVTFTGMGFHSQHWWAKGEGAAMELGPCLAPLAPWRERMVFIRGLWNEQANNGVIHCMQTGNILSGATMSKQEVHTGVSFDQVMAQRIGDRTRLPSLVLGCEEAIPGLQDGHPLLYSSHISWSSAVSPSWTETRPALAFDQLFRTDRGRDDRRVVDAVLEDARSLQRKLSSLDRQRFEEYLGSVHEIEGRIKRAGQEREAGGWKPTLSGPDRPRPADGIPAEIPEYWKLMNDILLLAFRTDSTRIATLKYCNDGSILTHTHLGVHDQHHQLSHTQPQQLVTVNQFFMSQLAYLCADGRD